MGFGSGLLLACAILGWAAPAHAQPADDLRARRVDSLYAHYDTAPSPGLAIAVVRDGQVVLRRGYGMASIEHGARITPQTVFDVASVSKQFTGLAIAMLSARGAISLDDDVAKYIPELAGLPHRVTIRHLLHHTSGIRDWPGTLSVGGWRFDDVIAFDQILRMAYRQRTLNFVPGTEHLYSNTGYNLLAEVVLRVTKQSFRAWTHEHLFAPLKMERTFFRNDHLEVVPDRAFGYARTAGGTWKHVPNSLTALGSSSLFSTVDDMARWMLNFEDGRVGGTAVRAMRTPGRLNDGSPVAYAFGVLTGSYRGLPMFTHSGSWAAFSTYLAYLPEQRFGVVVLANSSAIDAQAAVIRVTNIYLERELATANAPSSTPGAPPTQSVAAAPDSPTTQDVPAQQDIPTTVLDRYVGLYRLGPGWYTEIRRDGGRLVSQATNEGAATMTPRSEREFWIEAYGASMIFHRDPAGRVTHLEYRGAMRPRVTRSVAPTTRGLAELAASYESEELGTSYRVAHEDGRLVLHHPRHGGVLLTWVNGEEFSSPTWFLRSITFERDRRGRATSLVVNGDPRSRNIRFTRRR